MISASLECIFVHIPKCAGTSIESLLWPGERGPDQLWGGFIDPFHNRFQTGGLQHLHAEQIRTVVGTVTFNSFFKFAVVRNPFDRAVSQFVYLERRPDLRTYLGLSEGASFDEYLELVNGVIHVQWEPQHAFLTDRKTGELLVDQVIRFERLVPEMSQVLEVLGVKCKSFPHLNAGVRGHYREWYTKRRRKAVEDFYAKDLEFLNYEFRNQSSSNS